MATARRQHLRAPVGTSEEPLDKPSGTSFPLIAPTHADGSEVVPFAWCAEVRSRLRSQEPGQTHLMTQVAGARAEAAAQPVSSPPFALDFEAVSDAPRHPQSSPTTCNMARRDARKPHHLCSVSPSPPPPGRPSHPTHQVEVEHGTSPSHGARAMQQGSHGQGNEASIPTRAPDPALPTLHSEPEARARTPGAPVSMLVQQHQRESQEQTPHTSTGGPLSFPPRAFVNKKATTRPHSQSNASKN